MSSLNSSIKLSIVVTTYNWPYALRAVLRALIHQKTNIPFEILVADDGSKEETTKLIRGLKTRFTLPLIHIWQPDEGFRAAAIRNKAIAAATGNYIVFLDGDCIPREDFVERHAKLAESGCFVVGNRVLLDRIFTLKVLSEDLPVQTWTLWSWTKAWFKGYCNRLLPFLSLPLGRLRLAFERRWQGAKGCNLGVWKSDLLKINGWEEQFIGWGYEDSDLVIRLIRAGIKRKEARFYIPVIHLWHPEHDRSRERENWALLKYNQTNDHSLAHTGLSQYTLKSTE